MLSWMLWKKAYGNFHVANVVEKGLFPLLLEMNLGGFCSLWPMLLLVEWMFVGVLDIVSYGLGWVLWECFV